MKGKSFRSQSVSLILGHNTTLRSWTNGQVDLNGFQVFDRGCLKSLKEDLRGERKLGFVNARSAKKFEMFSKIKAKYPTWTKIMSSIAATVKVNTALAEFLVAIIEHTEEIFDTGQTGVRLH